MKDYANHPEVSAFTLGGFDRFLAPMSKAPSTFPHYHKPIPKGVTHLDVYRVLELFGVESPCLQHAIKKLLVAGGRGQKDVAQDVAEAIATLQRWQAMRAEECQA